jgi:ATP/maltotriose-dependent transcriptional regulator MalT
LTKHIKLAPKCSFTITLQDKDPQVLTLLPELRSIAPTFLNQVLEFACAGLQAAVVHPLVEPLSERELEVLRLIASGLKNSEIAQEPTITTGTNGNLH